MNGKAERFADFHQRLREYQMRTWAAAQPIEQVAQENAVEIVLMNGWLDNDITCQSEHRLTGKESCTIEVTHRITVACNGWHGLVCVVSARLEQSRIDEGTKHRSCGRPYGDCLSVVPFG